MEYRNTVDVYTDSPYMLILGIKAQHNHGTTFLSENA